MRVLSRTFLVWFGPKAHVPGVVMPPYTFQTDGLVSYLLEAPACDSADLQITTWIQSRLA